MNYLTRMYLNPRRRQTIRFLRDPQALHAAVESAFPPRGDFSRTLWRLDADGDERKLLILSAEPPSLEHLQEQAGWANEITWESRPYGSLLSRLTRGQQYAFRLTANPVHSVLLPTGKRKRLAHVSVPYQLMWLAQRAEQIGVRFLDEDGRTTEPLADRRAPGGGLTSVLVSHRETLHFRRGAQQVTIARARFEGSLEVVDVERLRDALTQGVGKAKAYGCGLLTLAPLQQTTAGE